MSATAAPDPSDPAHRTSSSAESAASSPSPGPRPVGVPPAPDAPGRTRSGRPARRHLLRAGAALVVMVLVSVGWAGHRHREARADERLTTAQEVLAAATTDLRLARQDGQAVLAGSAGRVHDEAVRRDLATLLADGTGTDLARDLTRAERTRRAAALADDRRDRTTALVAATEVVRAAQEAWEHATATTALAEAVDALTAAVEESAALLAASEGRVLDDAARHALTATVEAAVAVRDAPAPDGTTALVAAAAEARAHVEHLAAARAAVGEARAAWQSEQERVAAQAAQRAAGSSSSTGDRARGGTGAGAGGGRGSSSGGGEGASGGTGWVQGWKPGDAVPPGNEVVVETEGGAWCGDSQGAVWDC